MIHSTQKKWFSILLALGFMILMSSIGIYLLTYIVPFSRSVVGIEHASNAYYQAYSGIEDALLYSYSGGIGFDTSTWIVLDVDYWYNTYSSGTDIPREWFWESPFDDEWNTISQSQWIQVSIWNGRFTNPGASSQRLQMKFRVPDFDRDSLSLPDSLDDTPDDDLILVTMSSPTNSMSSQSGALMLESDINDIYRDIFDTMNFWRGVYQDGTLDNFINFYNAECVSQECTLKLTLINPLVSDAASNPSLPFLEYKILSGRSIPTQFRQIQATGQSIGFRKNLEISVLQQNTNIAFDFAIFQ